MRVHSDDTLWNIMLQRTVHQDPDLVIPTLCKLLRVWKDDCQRWSQGGSLQNLLTDTCFCLLRADMVGLIDMLLWYADSCVVWLLSTSNPELWLSAMELLVTELNVLLKLLDHETLSSATEEKKTAVKNLLKRLQPSGKHQNYMRKILCCVIW